MYYLRPCLRSHTTISDVFFVPIIIFLKISKSMYRGWIHSHSSTILLNKQIRWHSYICTNRLMSFENCYIIYNTIKINSCGMRIQFIYYREIVSFCNQLFLFFSMFFESFKICNYIRERRFFP